MNKIYTPILYFPRWIDKGLSLKPKLKNEYHACIYDKAKFDLYGENAPIEQEAWAYNVFTNLGLDKIRRTDWTSSNFSYGRTPHTIMQYCGIGTGSGTPSISDTTFFNFLSYADMASSEEVSNNDTYSIDHDTEEYYHRHKFFWDLKEGNGNLTEVGICYSGNHTVTHAMFQDAEGNPITIVKTDTKILIITVTLYLERGTSDANAVILDDVIDGLISSQSDRGTFVFRYGAAGGWGSIWLGNEDISVDRTDCYETDYPVLGDERISKNVIESAPSSTGYGVSIYTDWNLEEGNGTWYEVGFRTGIGGIGQKNAARFDLPSGVISENTIVKDNSKKLRVSFELHFTQ